jgi:alkyl hydroperoxide reductase subunit AhpF
MPSLLNDQIKEQISDVFTELKSPVQVLFFRKQTDCPTCEDAHNLLQEVADLSPQISLAVYDLETDGGIASQYRVDKAPALVIAGLEGEQVLDYGIRFYGIPSGHEFSTLIHDLILVSTRDSGLSEETRSYLAEVSKPVLLQVFVTPG